MTLEQRAGFADTLELDRVGALDEGESLTEILSAGLVRHDDDHAFDRTDAHVAPRNEFARSDLFGTEQTPARLSMDSRKTQDLPM